MLTAVKSFKDLIASVPGFKVEVEFKVEVRLGSLDIEPVPRLMFSFR